MNHMPPRPHTTLARSVNRALGDIRRGVPVCIISSGAVFVAVAVETATAGTLAEFAASSLGQASSSWPSRAPPISALLCPGHLAR